MSVADAPQRFSWAGTELYRTLSDTFPSLRTKKQNVLDIELLADKIGMTKEGVYKWLRAGSILSKKGLERIIELANQPEYAAALTEAGRTPPTKQDFARFLLS
jgi:hypothetical protein